MLALRTLGCRSALLARSIKPISTIRFYTEGATGAPRASGSSDAFNQREMAQENMYVLEHEKEKLAALKEAVKRQREHLQAVEKEIESLGNSK